MDININKVWKLNNNQYPLFGTTNSLAEFPFMAEYVTNHNSFDRNFMLEYGYMFPIWNVDDAESETGVVTQFRSDATDVIRKHKVDLQRLWDITQLEYDPIENYNRTEKTENAKSGSDTQSNAYGAYTETMTKGEQNDQDVYGAKSITNTQGAQSNSNTFGEITNTSGAQSNSSTNQVAAFNSNNYEDNEKTSESFGEKIDKVSSHSDSQEIGARTDTTSENERTDSHKSGARTDGVEHSTKDDTLTTSYGSKNTTTSTVRGNIGTLTTQQMAQSEVDLWSGFNFYNKLFDIIIEELCYFADDGDAPLLTPLQNSIF